MSSSCTHSVSQSCPKLSGAESSSCAHVCHITSLGLFCLFIFIDSKLSAINFNFEMMNHLTAFYNVPSPCCKTDLNSVNVSHLQKCSKYPINGWCLLTSLQFVFIFWDASLYAQHEVYTELFHIYRKIAIQSFLLFVLNSLETLLFLRIPCHYIPHIVSF